MNTIFRLKGVSHSFVALIILSLIISLNWISGYYFPEDEEERNTIDNAWQQMATIEAISLGGSTAVSIDFEALGQHGAALYGSSTDPFESEALLKLLLPRAKELKTVYFAVDPLILTSDNTYRNTKRRRVYYRALSHYPNQGLIAGDWRNYLIATYFPLIRGDTWQAPLRTLYQWLFYKGGKPVTIPVITGDVTEETHKIQIYNKIAVNGHMYTQDTRDVVYRHPDIQERVEKAIMRIQQHVHAIGAQLVLIEPPVTQAYAEHMQSITSNYQSRFTQLMERCRTQGAIVLNYRSNHNFHSNYALFRDANHLNAHGATLFSSILRKDVDLQQATARKLDKSLVI